MLDLIILALIGRTSLRKIENSKTVKANAALICNIIEGKPAGYGALGKPLQRFFVKLEQSTKLCVALTGVLCALIAMFVSGFLFSVSDSMLHLLHMVVTDASTYNFLAAALIIIIAGAWLTTYCLGFIGSLFLVVHLQRWQEARRAERLAEEHA